jgi:hypothetical protein
MTLILYAVVITAALFAGIFAATYFKDLKNKHRMAKTNQLKPVKIKGMN